MRSKRQLVATHGNGFGLFPRFLGVRGFATGCHWLRPLGSTNAPYPWPESLMGSRIRRPSVLGAQARPLPRREGVERPTETTGQLQDTGPGGVSFLSYPTRPKRLRGHQTRMPREKIAVRGTGPKSRLSWE